MTAVEKASNAVFIPDDMLVSQMAEVRSCQDKVFFPSVAQQVLEGYAVLDTYGESQGVQRLEGYGIDSHPGFIVRDRIFGQLSRVPVLSCSFRRT